MTEGMKTSEFKVAFVAAATAVASAFMGQISWGQAVTALVALVIAYTTSRTVVKTIK